MTDSHDHATPSDSRAVTKKKHNHRSQDATTDLSSGWRDVYAALDVDPSIEPDALAAATRVDRPDHYRRRRARKVAI